MEIGTKALAIPVSISHYTILRKLGAGGMGEVYLAEDNILNRRVAIKFLLEDSLTDPHANRRFIREAQAAARLDHPNICAIHEIGEEAGRSFIVMQYVEGDTLAHKIRKGWRNLSECLAIATQVADALAEAHSHGIIHRDISPQNIMLTARDQAMVMDFGLAKVVRDKSVVDREALTESLPVPETLVGTVLYMSPEQVKGESVDARSDIFSFGAVLYEMITGHLAFAAENVAVTIWAIVSKDPEPLTRYSRDIPSELQRIVNKALHKDREQRYQTAKDLLIDLRSLKHCIEFQIELEQSVSHSDYARAIDSIAVLPLENACHDEETEYLSDGITESLINSLSQLQQLRVMARTTAFRYKDKEIDPLKVGRELGVQTILTGKLMQRGDGLAIQVELVETSNGWQLWGGRYDRKLSDLLAVRQELVRDVTEKLRLKLGGDDDRRLTKGDAINTEAYRSYLRGRYFWNKRTEDELRKAIREFNEATDKDPNYALGYVGLADCYLLLQEYASTPSTEATAKARAAVDRALQIDPSLAEAHASLAAVEQFSWNFKEAEAEFQRAIELNPNYATVHHWYGLLLRMMPGRQQEAMAEMNRAQQIDPLSPIISVNVVYIYQDKGELNAAIEATKKVIELSPSFAEAHSALGMAYRRQKRYREAIAAVQKAVDLSPHQSFYLSELGACYALAGKTAKALAILNRLEERYCKGQALGQNLARLNAALDDIERSFAWLEKDFQARSGVLPDIAYSDILREKLGNDSRWKDLLQGIGLLTS